MEPCFPGDETPARRWEAVNEFPSLLCLRACTAFALLLKLSLSQPMNCLTFTLPILSLIPLRGSA